LAEDIHDHLGVAERLWIYVAIGGDDTDAAIAALIAVAVRERAVLPRNLIDALQNWSRVHAGDPAERLLRPFPDLL
jgi:hypothetical protein